MELISSITPVVISLVVKWYFEMHVKELGSLFGNRPVEEKVMHCVKQMYLSYKLLGYILNFALKYLQVNRMCLISNDQFLRSCTDTRIYIKVCCREA